GPLESIVGIQTHDKRTARCLNAGVCRSGKALIPLLYEAHGEASRDVSGVIGRAVINDDHLDWRIALSQRTVDRLGQEAAVVEARNNDADESQRHQFWHMVTNERPTR